MHQLLLMQSHIPYNTVYFSGKPQNIKIMYGTNTSEKYDAQLSMQTTINYDHKIWLFMNHLINTIEPHRSAQLIYLPSFWSHEYVIDGGLSISISHSLEVFNCEKGWLSQLTLLCTIVHWQLCTLISNCSAKEIQAKEIWWWLAFFQWSMLLVMLS